MGNVKQKKTTLTVIDVIANRISFDFDLFDLDDVIIDERARFLDSYIDFISNMVKIVVIPRGIMTSFIKFRYFKHENRMKTLY